MALSFKVAHLVPIQFDQHLPRFVSNIAITSRNLNYNISANSTASSLAPRHGRESLCEHCRFDFFVLEDDQVSIQKSDECTRRQLELDIKLDKLDEAMEHVIAKRAAPTRITIPVGQKTRVDDFPEVGNILLVVEGTQDPVKLDVSTSSRPNRLFASYPGANSIFTGDKLLTTPNNKYNADQQMFEALGNVFESAV
ncbi:hypothetical protein B0O80DRAFT_422830 [Mortierella sp. GBAus27b]|nr:hypothetical protein B0O80DRAFT_422830 [Mortierella sp. GBAus27b]